MEEKNTPNGEEVALTAVEVYHVMPPEKVRITISKGGMARFTSSAARMLELEAGEPILFLRNVGDPSDEAIYMQFVEHEKAIEVKERGGSFKFSGNGFRNAFGLPRDRANKLLIGNPFIVDGQLTYPLELQEEEVDSND